MNILVTGANGQLGNEMRIVSQHTTDHYIFTDVNQVEGLETTFLDITDMNAIRKMVKENDVKAIVNCAAWTNVDACETDEKLAALAEKLNADAPENLAKAMKEVDGLLIQISTDYVFGKEPYNVPCNPDQKGTPTGVYGTTKLHGEQKIMATGCDYVIIRTAWLYSEFGKNFCKTMLNLTATKPQLNGGPRTQLAGGSGNLSEKLLLWSRLQPNVRWAWWLTPSRTILVRVQWDFPKLLPGITVVRKLI